MPDIQTVFQRTEKKYRLCRDQEAVLMHELSGRMQEDDYGCYTVGSLYFDTEDYRLVRDSLEKPVYKEKLRLRGYGVPQGTASVFWELKKKYDGVTYKRRAVLPLHRAEQYFRRGIPAEESQVLQEIDWFLQFYRPAPRVYIAYDRTALSCPEIEGLRITFDHRLRWRDSRLRLSEGDDGALLLPEDEVLMEIKIPGAMPVWLAELLSGMALFPTSFSKYGTCYRNYLSAGVTADTQKGGIICA